MRPLTLALKASAGRVEWQKERQKGWATQPHLQSFAPFANKRKPVTGLVQGSKGMDPEKVEAAGRDARRVWSTPPP